MRVRVKARVKVRVVLLRAGDGYVAARLSHGREQVAVAHLVRG